MYGEFSTPTRAVQSRQLNKITSAKMEPISSRPHASITLSGGCGSKNYERLAARQRQWLNRPEFSDEFRYQEQFKHQEVNINRGNEMDSYPDELDDDTMHSFEEPPKKRASSHNNCWNIENLMSNCCYDGVTGQLLSKELCLKNLNSALKSKKKFDFYEALQPRMSKSHCLLSFCLLILDRSSKRSTKEENQPKIVFDLAKAREVDEERMLPGGKKVLITSLIEASMTANWVGKTAVTKAVISVLKELLHRDEYFLVYSSPDSDRHTSYPPIEREFFSMFASVLSSGFRMDAEYSSHVALVATIRGVTRNFIDKQRREKESTQEQYVPMLLKKFFEHFQSDPLFRFGEAPIQDSPRISAVANCLKRHSVKMTTSHFPADNTSNDAEEPSIGPPVLKKSLRTGRKRGHN